MLIEQRAVIKGKHQLTLKITLEHYLKIIVQ